MCIAVKQKRLLLVTNLQILCPERFKPDSERSERSRLKYYVY